jgi:nitrogen PTS system EIIA component
MSTLAELVPPAHVFVGLRVPDKLGLLKELARRAAAVLGVPASEIVAALAARESLGSTGIGAGSAVPHARMPSLAAMATFLARLERPVDYVAIDGRPVDLVFLLLGPAQAHAEHLAALAAATRRLRDPAVADALRAAGNAIALRERFVASQTS